MNYEKLIKEAAAKRDLKNTLDQQSRKEMLDEYVGKIKALKNRIKTMLEVEKLLIDNKFDYQKICTDSMNHKLGFAAGKRSIGIYAGGACGEWDLIVGDNGIPLMYGRKIIRVPDYSDIDVLKRFVHQFNDFETRVENFVSSL